MHIVIPARYASSRFPGKPLVEIAGKSLLRRVWEQCVQVVSAQDVIVATDDERIREHCRTQDMRCMMTSKACKTGSDRVWEVMRECQLDVVVNVQGDEPLIDPHWIETVMDAAAQRPGEVVNAMATIESDTEFRSSAVPKVCAAPDGRLLYMSRGAVPTTKALELSVAHKQVCIYAFPRQALESFAACEEKTPLEAIEDIEILRFLELGVPVHMVTVQGASVAVDYPEDVARVEQLLHETED